jgi:PAS domain S-box-containing protein
LPLSCQTGSGLTRGRESFLSPISQPLRLLIVEDSSDDAEIIAREVRRVGYDLEVRRIDQKADFLDALESAPDIILMDYSMPSFGAQEALAIVAERGLDIPVIVISGNLTDEGAVECLRLGAADYLLKDRLARLGAAIERALHEKKARGTHHATEQALRMSEEQFRRLADNAQDIIFRYSLQPEPHFTYLSPSVQTITGYSPEDFYTAPQTWAQRCLIEWDQLPEAAPADRTGYAFLQSGSKMRFRAKNGEMVWLDQRVVMVAGADGLPAQVEGIIRDITEGEQRERELEAVTSVANAMRTVTSRDEIEIVVLERITDLLCTDGVALAMRSLSGDASTIEKATGIWAPFVGKRVKDTDALFEGGDAPTPQAFGLGGSLPDVLCLPLVTQGQAIGILWVGRAVEIHDEEMRLLTAVADIAANALRRTSLYEQTQRRLQDITALRAIDLAITSSLDLHVTLNFFLDQVTIRLGIHAATVMILDGRTQLLQYAAGRGFRTQVVQNARLRLGEGYAGRAALEHRLVSVQDLTGRKEPFRHIPMFAEEEFVSYFAAPLISKGQVKGVLEIFHRTRMEPDPEWLEFLDTLAVQAAIAIDNSALFEDLQRSNLELAMAYDATIEGWSRALDMRDRETEGHTLRVTEMAMRLARIMDVPDEELIHVRRGALLHDIGKMGIPDSILLKPGPLSDDEWRIMRRHPEFAHELLALIAYLRPALDIPYCHHEKWDGSGYPRGLRGDAIPLPARIFAVVDVWDALRSERPYRGAWPEEKVRSFVREESGRHFDPHVVDSFLQMLTQDGFLHGQRAEAN